MYDQVLEEAEMDCSQPGQMKFNFQGQPPDHTKLPENDVVGVTAVLLTCSYKDNQEFLRVGYYVYNYYEDEALSLEPPATPDVTKLVRHILVEKPRVTKFQIDWDDMPQSSGADMSGAN